MQREGDWPKEGREKDRSRPVMLSQRAWESGRNVKLTLATKNMGNRQICDYRSSSFLILTHNLYYNTECVASISLCIIRIFH